MLFPSDPFIQIAFGITLLYTVSLPFVKRGLRRYRPKTSFLTMQLADFDALAHALESARSDEERLQCARLLRILRLLYSLPFVAILLIVASMFATKCLS